MNEEEIIKKIRKDYKPLADKIRLNIDDRNADRTELDMIFSIRVTTIVNNISQIDLDSDSLSIFYRMHTERMLFQIEKNLYGILPAFNIKPEATLSETNTKIRIDSHIPDDVILMSPKTYAVFLPNPKGFPFRMRQF